MDLSRSRERSNENTCEVDQKTCFNPRMRVGEIVAEPLAIHEPGPEPSEMPSIFAERKDVPGSNCFSFFGFSNLDVSLSSRNNIHLRANLRNRCP
jgi:ABC-type glutathione transport system ATPase component